MIKKILFFIIFILIFSLNIYGAEPEKEILDSIQGELSDFEATLPDDIRNILPNELFDGDFSSLSNGEIDHMTFIDASINSLLANLPSALSSITLILVAVIISSIFDTMSSGLESISLRESYNLCSSLCISVLVFNLIGEISINALSYMKALCNAMNGLAHIMATVHIMEGKISTAALGNGTMMMFIALIENIIVSFLAPIVNICLALSCVKSVSNEKNIGGISSLIRNTFITLTVFTMMVFSFVFSFQNTLTQSADSLSMRTAKFAIGSFIPIIGPSISEALTTVTSSISYVKNALGVIGLVSVLLLTLPVIASLYVHKLLLDITASLSGMIGFDKGKEIISDASGICGFILALSACTGVFFILALTIFIKTSIGG